MEKTVYKDCHLKPEKISDIIRCSEKPNQRILIVFWHGIGDTLMFLPLYKYLTEMFTDHHFDLSLLPGVGQAEFIGDCLELPESDFIKNHDAAFVISFPMVEGGAANTMTKVEHCCKNEMGFPIPESGMELPYKEPVANKLVGIHLQGTCLPGSTNPDDAQAELIWNDIKNAGYIPIDLHFCHVFHNPVNKVYPWVTRGCRDLAPSLSMLQMMIQNCAAVCAVASGPFVISACIKPEKTIYLEKHHTSNCYIKGGFKNVIDLKVYGNSNMPEQSQAERIKLIQMLGAIAKKG
jgi:hypothetical protein